MRCCRIRSKRPCFWQLACGAWRAGKRQGAALRMRRSAACPAAARLSMKLTRRKAGAAHPGKCSACSGPHSPAPFKTRSCLRAAAQCQRQQHTAHPSSPSCKPGLHHGGPAGRLYLQTAHRAGWSSAVHAGQQEGKQAHKQTGTCGMQVPSIVASQHIQLWQLFGEPHPSRHRPANAQVAEVGGLGRQPPGAGGVQH